VSAAGWPNDKSSSVRQDIKSCSPRQGFYPRLSAISVANCHYVVTFLVAALGFLNAGQVRKNGVVHMKLTSALLIGIAVGVLVIVLIAAAISPAVAASPAAGPVAVAVAGVFGLLAKLLSSK